VPERPGLPRRAAAEALAAFALVFAGCGAVVTDTVRDGALGAVGVSLVFGLVIMAMIYATGHLSGAHINPAVTIAFWSSRRFPTAEVVPYLAAQCGGAIAAALTLRTVLGPGGSLGATLPHLPIMAAFTVEWLLSFALMFVIMAVATDDRVAGGSAALAVGFTVGFCALLGGPLTGASMNPARSLGPAVAWNQWHAHWLYWAAPITAALAAARVYDFLRPACPPRRLLGTDGR
jgi:aquaporin NIP